MTGKTTIAAVETDPTETLELVGAEVAIETPSEVTDDWWEEPVAAPRRPWFAIGTAVLTVAALAGWTALFVMTNMTAMQESRDLSQWTGWIRDWSVPVLLLAVVWLLMMRNSAREAQRFGATARLLGDESARLEQRLTVVNRELSLAREFIAGQTRDIDALGRIATERLSQHSDKLAGLIHDNGARIDAIGDVSTAALENMEKLRNQLPVIASSAKDVTNNVATAGRTAHAQIEDLVTGFNKLNEFGQASERQVGTLRGQVNDAIAEFTKQAEQLGQIGEQRFAALAEQGDEFRAALDAREVEALAAVRSRASALSEELAGARGMLDAHEAESLTSLRARLSAVRDESGALVRALREGESGALETWQSAIAKLEDDLREAIGKVGEIDRKAMESARSRLAELSSEAQQVDARLSERDQLFAAELNKRTEEFDARHAAFVTRLTVQMASLEEAAARHRSDQEVHIDTLTSQGNALAERLGDFGQQMQAITGHSGDAEARISSSLAALSDKLASSKEALAGTDSAITALTDNSVRLLELIQASVQHTTENLPQAIGVSEERLSNIETRVAALRDNADAAAAQGEALAGHAATSQQMLSEAVTQVSALHGLIAQDGAHQLETVASLQVALQQVRSESIAVAEQAQGQLTKSIDELNSAARDAVSGIETMSAASITALAARIGDESGAAMSQAMQERAAELAGQLETASARAAGVSREAAMQLRDQLAKVSELASSLERRVEHARNRAEEQVDHDFARRVALITESLNSNAIDIARAMDSEVSDTAWAAYLKGDRGIFTRRAVRLLEAPEAKAVAQLYGDDREFRDHVSRYIHDFEAMLRQLLSTRDGHALGVTLLSSDMGKLYVSLAQAIERLRN